MTIWSRWADEDTIEQEQQLVEYGWIKNNYGWIDPITGEQVLFGQAAKIQRER